MRSKLHFSKDWIKLASKLKVVGRLGSGMDNIDVEFAESQGIACYNAPEGNRNAVAEQTIGIMLSLLANVYRSAKQVERNIWDRKGNIGIELEQLTLGIIGYGNVGSQLAKRLRGFGCEVLAYDKYKKDYGNEFVKETDLEEIFEKADVVSFHVPLNESSKYMFNSHFISSMRKSFYLLNLSRGEVVKTSDLINGFKDGKILGCGLDVLENEKLETLTTEQENNFTYITENENIILTPHIGGLTQNSFIRLAEVLSDKILQWAKGRPLVN